MNGNPFPNFWWQLGRCTHQHRDIVLVGERLAEHMAAEGPGRAQDQESGHVGGQCNGAARAPLVYLTPIGRSSARVRRMLRRPRIACLDFVTTPSTSSLFLNRTAWNGLCGPVGRAL
jgi:hypothetical protein